MRRGRSLATRAQTMGPHALMNSHVAEPPVSQVGPCVGGGRLLRLDADRCACTSSQRKQKRAHPGVQVEHGVFRPHSGPFPDELNDALGLGSVHLEEGVGRDSVARAAQLLDEAGLSAEHFGWRAVARAAAALAGGEDPGESGHALHEGRRCRLEEGWAAVAEESCESAAGREGDEGFDLQESGALRGGLGQPRHCLQQGRAHLLGERMLEAALSERHDIVAPVPGEAERHVARLGEVCVILRAIAVPPGIVHAPGVGDLNIGQPADAREGIVDEGGLVAELGLV